MLQFIVYASFITNGLLLVTRYAALLAPRFVFRLSTRAVLKIKWRGTTHISSLC